MYVHTCSKRRMSKLHTAAARTLDYQYNNNKKKDSTIQVVPVQVQVVSISSMFDSMDLNSLLPRSSPASVSLLDYERSGNGNGNGTAAGSLQDDETSWCPSLTWQERLIGCGACMVLGYLLSFGSFFRFKDLMLGNPLPFVLHTTVGNILALTGSCFLTGPASQYQKMMHNKRKYATVAYLGSLTLTLLVVVVVPAFWGRALLLIVLLLVQYVAITWYCLSYIPYAREAIQAYLNRMFQSVDG